MRSVPAPCHHHQPCYVPRPAWASDRPGLLTQAWVRHSPTTIQRRLLHCLGTALRIGHHPHRRPSEGRREAGRGGGEGATLREPAQTPAIPKEFWSPRRRLDLNGGARVGILPTHLNQALRSFPGRAVGG